MSEYALVIGNKNYSSWSLRPWLLMRELGIQFEEVRIPLYTPDTAETLAKYSPSMKVPTLVHGATTIWDSLAICEYLAEGYLEAWPKEPAARALARSISAEMHAGFESLRGEMPMNCRRRVPGFVVSAAATQDVERVLTIWRQCRQQYGDQGPWLFGQFSIADAMYAPVAMRFMTYNVALDETGRAWFDTLLANPHMQAWIEAGRTESEVIQASEV